MKVFGEHIAIQETDEHVETPVGHCCRYCDEPIRAGEAGIFVNFHDSGNWKLVPEHLECFLRQIVGSVAHQQRRCTCFGGEADTYPTRTRRQDARAALDHWQTLQDPIPTHTHTHTHTHATCVPQPAELGADVLYAGKRIARVAEVFVTRDGKHFRLSPLRSLRLRNHSPTGFEWGYAGSGPAQLALGILLDFSHQDDIALAHYQDFKREVIGRLEKETWQLTGQQIRDWFEHQGLCLVNNNHQPQKENAA